MKGNEFERLLAVAQRKNKFDQSNTWSNGSKTYLAEIRKELVEVEDEIETNNKPELEEELGDVLWDYLNLLLSLDEENKISINSVLSKAINKFDERISAIENGQSWSEIKEVQRVRKREEAK
jgi:NTP pyrophosphatase (non-canonical NTP hydrolase)